MTTAGLLDRKREAVESFRGFTEGRGAAPRYPLEIYLEVSNVCDLRCVMCTRFSAFNPARKQAIWDVDPGFLDEDGAAAALAPLLERALIVHAFGYGEPTIHPDFPAFLAHLARYQVVVDFFTNGMHLTPDLARHLVEVSVHHLTVSFSGATAADYESVYQGGSFARVLSGLAAVRDAKRAAGSAYPRVHVNSLTFDHHVRALDRFVALAAEYGVARVELTRLLEHTAVVPQLEGHAADLRSPEIREAIARGREAAARLGVELAIHPMIEAELSMPPRAASGAAAARLPLSDFADVAAGLPVLPPSREGGPRPIAVELGSDSIDAIRRALEVRSVSASPDASRFYCLEPFKTFYLRRGGPVKTCCYMSDDAPGMGDIRRSGGEEIWNGDAYAVVRGAIVNGQYPMAACAHCLEKRQAPASHGVDAMLRDYAAWHPAAAGPPFDEATIAALAGAPGDRIVERIFERAPAAAVSPGGGDRIAKILERLAHDDVWWSLFEGRVDHVSEAGVAGWVFAPAYSDLRFPVTVRAGGRKIAVAVADRLRPDLVASGKGDGRYGFAIEAPMSPEEARIARVELGDSGRALERIPALRNGRTSAVPEEYRAAQTESASGR